MPDRRTLEGVEIARVGTFRLSTGEHTFTREQLAAAVANADNYTPRIGIGHEDPRFDAPELDGDPAFGKVVNLRLAEDGDLLLGDLAEMPAWLADNAPAAYPGRSLEGVAKQDDLEIRTVKLLGTTKPGITTLADLPKAIAASVAAGETTEDQATIAVRTLWAAAGTNLDDLRDAFYALHPTDPSNDGDWWCVQEVQINPNQLIVEHSTDGSTYRVPWSVNTDGTFSFGGLVEVTVEYRDVAASAAASRVIHRAPASRPNQKEESIVDPKILREQLGLAEDASDADVTAKLAELNTRPTEEQVEQQVSEKVEEQLPEAVAAAVAAKAAKSDDETVTLDKAAFEELKASAAKGAEAHDRLEQEAKETFLAAAVEKGKFPPSRVEHYGKRYDSDPEGTRAEVDALADDVIPVTERGIAASSEAEDTNLTTTGWFPQLTEA
jgi:hypothetical protein